jgi:hypothetical protein
LKTTEQASNNNNNIKTATDNKSLEKKSGTRSPVISD